MPLHEQYNTIIHKICYHAVLSWQPMQLRMQFLQNIMRRDCSRIDNVATSSSVITLDLILL